MKLRYPFVSLDKDESYADIPVTPEISVKGRKIQDSIDLETEGIRHKVRGIGQKRWLMSRNEHLVLVVMTIFRSESEIVDINYSSKIHFDDIIASCWRSIVVETNAI